MGLGTFRPNRNARKSGMNPIFQRAPMEVPHGMADDKLMIHPEFNHVSLDERRMDASLRRKTGVTDIKHAGSSSAGGDGWFHLGSNASSFKRRGE